MHMTIYDDTFAVQKRKMEESVLKNGTLLGLVHFHLKVATFRYSLLHFRYIVFYVGWKHKSLTFNNATFSYKSMAKLWLYFYAKESAFQKDGIKSGCKIANYKYFSVYL